MTNLMITKVIICAPNQYADDHHLLEAYPLC